MGNNIYVSVDIETDGPCPGLNSMLSLGAVAFGKTGKEMGEFFSNLVPLDGASADKDTMEWWSNHPHAYATATCDQVDPGIVVGTFRDWLIRLPGRPVFVAYPAGFDFTFVTYYFHRFKYDCPFGFASLDIKSYAMGMMGTEDFTHVVKRNMPKRWFSDDDRHPHIAVEDAREQGQMFMRMYLERQETLCVDYA